MSTNVTKENLQEFATKLHAKNKTIFATKTDVGTPLVATTAAGMTDTTKIYVYTGSETGYTAGNWYYYNGSAWASGGVYNAEAIETDTTLSVSGMAADAKAVGDEFAKDLWGVPLAVREAIYTLLNSAAYATTGLTDEIAVVENWAEEVYSLSLSAATLSLNQDTPQLVVATVVPSTASVSWSSSDTDVATVNAGVVTGVSNGTCVITATAGSLSATCEVTVSGFATLSSISAVYTQSGTVYDTTPLNDLKTDLVVTATYSDSSTVTITSYSLSGTLTVGTSTITVTYQDKTTTFNVTVSLCLDDIAYGTLTYRDIFITNNIIALGDFETPMTIDSTWRHADSLWTYKSNAGSPVQSTEASSSPTHSLKCFGTGSTQIAYSNSTGTISAGSYLCCIAVKVDRYVAGNAGIQAGTPIQNYVERVTFGMQEVTDGFVPCVEILNVAADRLGMFTYIGTMSSANCDAYIDDVVITPVPSGLSKADALTLYGNYLDIIKGMAV